MGITTQGWGSLGGLISVRGFGGPVGKPIYACVTLNVADDAEIELNMSVDAEVVLDCGEDAEVMLDCGEDTEVVLDVGADAEIILNSRERCS